MKKFLFCIWMGSLMALLGCQEEVLTNEDHVGGRKVTATASIHGSADSRVVLTPGTDNDEHPIVKVDWKESGEQFYVVEENGQTPVLFTQTSGSKFEGTLTGEGGALHAYYGHTKSGNSIKYDISSQDGTLNGKYMLMEAYNDGSSVADDEELSFKFKHTTAILKLTFKNGNSVLNKSITSIVMNNTKNSKTSGSNKTKVTVNPKKLEDIYVFLPTPMENIAEGTVSAYPAKHKFTFSVAVGERNFTGSLTIPADMSIEAGKLYTATVKLSEIYPYVTFSSTVEQTMTAKQFYPSDYPMTSTFSSRAGSTVYGLQYSVNGGTWKDVAYDEGIDFGGTKGNLLLRGNGGIGTAEKITYDNGTEEVTGFKGVRLTFGGSEGSVTSSGDIRTLVKYSSYTTASTANTRFYGLFENCIQLATAPELPATTLADNCYARMFYNTKLTKAPDLPATQLSERCYYEMFRSCTSLTSAPALPARTLQEACYSGMFQDCTGLSEAPKLKATTLVTSCYENMFSGCSNLNSVTMLATNVEAESCLNNWLNEVSASGSVNVAEGMTDLVTNASGGIPSGWTVKVKSDDVLPGYGYVEGY